MQLISKNAVSNRSKNILYFLDFKSLWCIGQKHESCRRKKHISLPHYKLHLNRHLFNFATLLVFFFYLKLKFASYALFVMQRSIYLDSFDVAVRE